LDADNETHCHSKGPTIPYMQGAILEEESCSHGDKIFYGKKRSFISEKQTFIRKKTNIKRKKTFIWKKLKIPMEKTDRAGDALLRRQRHQVALSGRVLVKPAITEAATRLRGQGLDEVFLLVQELQLVATCTGIVGSYSRHDVRFMHRTHPLQCCS
jgi:hypothetical protein